MGSSTASCYLIIRNENEGRSYLSPEADIVRMTKNKPRLAKGEIAVQITLNVDNKIFAEFIPTVSAELISEQVITPTLTVEDAPPSDDPDEPAEADTD